MYANPEYVVYFRRRAEYRFVVACGSEPRRETSRYGDNIRQNVAENRAYDFVDIILRNNIRQIFFNGIVYADRGCNTTVRYSHDTDCGVVAVSDIAGCAERFAQGRGRHEIRRRYFVCQHNVCAPGFNVAFLLPYGIRAYGGVDVADMRPDVTADALVPSVHKRRMDEEKGVKK